MQLDRLLLDATGLPAGTSKNQQYARLAAMLTDAGSEVRVKTVEAWFLRKSVPSRWLMNIVAAAAAEARPIELATYA